jgi:tetratricopeptide (TPR) repeat protein
MHFLGLGVPHIKDNLNEWISWIKEERPQEVMAPLNFLVDPTKPGAVNRKINSHYMATLGSCKMAATLEVPYTQVRPALDSDMARAYGAGLLKAWVRTNFITIDAGMNRDDLSNAHFNTFRTEFIKSYRSKPKEMEQLANGYRTEQSPVLYRLEAANLLATLSISQRKYPEAKVLTQSVLLDGNASTYQFENAMLLNMEATVKDPKSEAEEVDALFVKAIALPYSALSYRAKVYDMASEFARRQMDYRTAIKRTRDQILVAAFYEKGRLWNRIATDFEALKLPMEAIGARKEAIKLLRPVLDPAEVSVFGAMMTLDYFDALYGISETPISELEVAAQKVLNHKVSSIAMKEHVTKLLKERK